MFGKRTTDEDLRRRLFVAAVAECGCFGPEAAERATHTAHEFAHVNGEHIDLIDLGCTLCSSHGQGYRVAA